ncbi:MAG: NAD(P)H-dependent flavin oxidoreductase [Hyphomonadaceae bacterium]
MRPPICDRFAIDVPLFAFSHYREVTAAVSRAGGFGVLGVLGFSPEELEEELSWIDAHVDGRPYGVDLAIPDNMNVRDEQALTTHALRARIPAEYWAFAQDFLRKYEIDPDVTVESDRDIPVGFMPDNAERAMEVVFRHPVRLVVQALGRVPPSMIQRGRAHGVPIGALVGAAKHAHRQIEAGVEVLIAQGYESGGHGAELTTMVLTPQIVEAAQGRAAVLAAGGIVKGRQMAAAMAMGADGAWTGSLWLTALESGVSPVVRKKLVRADSADTLRTRSGSGKLSRQLHSAWTGAWETQSGLPPLAMPFQGQLYAYVMDRAIKSAEAGNDKALAVLNHIVGQGVGLIDAQKPAGQIVREFRADFEAAMARMRALTV